MTAEQRIHRAAPEVLGLTDVLLARFRYQESQATF